MSQGLSLGHVLSYSVALVLPEHWRPQDGLPFDLSELSDSALESVLLEIRIRFAASNDRRVAGLIDILRAELVHRGLPPGSEHG
jgi:hypothetical protein